MVPSASNAAVSVIVPCYNAEPYIRETLQSIAGQAHTAAVEVIVVDDGSTDRSADIVATEFPWVRLIRTANHGASGARNTALSVAAGAFVQFIDADDLLPPNKLAIQIDALTASGADVAYGDWQYLEKQPDGSFRDGALVARELPADAEVALFTDVWFPLNAYLFRRHIVDAVGGFNLALPIIQDARFALDCALRGARFVRCTGFVAPYRIHSSQQNSKRDPIAFTRDIFTNAVEVEAWWHRHGGLTTTREEALLKVLQHVARASHRKDPETFAAVWQVLQRLRPGFCPSEPRSLKWLSHVVGYPNAEDVAYYYRRVKTFVETRGGTSPVPQAP